MGYAEIIKEKRKERIERLRKEYLEQLNKMKELIEDFHFKKIYIFGSFIKKEKFHFNSDIDLVIEGMKEENFLKFYGRLLRKTSIPIDLKRYEDLSPEMKRSIKRGGKVFYEKK